MNGPDSSAEMKEAYNRYTGRKVIFTILCAVLATVMFFVSLLVGTLDLTIEQVYGYFINHLMGATYPVDSPEWFDDHIVWEYRVPRAFFAILAGMALAVSGTVMQSVMKNPLADPYTTGISSGALFGVAVALTLGFTVGGYNGIGVVIDTILFSLVPMVLIIVLAPYFRKSPSTLILAGVAVSYLFNSLTSVLLVTTDSSTLSLVYRWQVGYLADVGWEAIPLTAFFTIGGLIILIPLAGKLNMMVLDDKEAKSMGLNIETLRILCLAVMSVMVSVVISYVGIIGFVGLVIPHILRLVLGSDNKYLIPAAASFGAVFLLGCDILARAVDLGGDVPTGVITSFIGAPIFLYLIVRNKRSMW